MPTWLLSLPNPTAIATGGQLDGSACLVREQRDIVFLPTNDGHPGWGCASIIVSAINPICLGPACHMFFAI